MAGKNPSEKMHPDVMISFNIQDLAFVQKISEKFQNEGWAVWYADPNKMDSKELGKKGEAILGCKVFIIVLSEVSAKDAKCQDELALAYISNSSIFPVGLNHYRAIAKFLDGGIKLMLAKINWSFFFKEEHFQTNMGPLIQSMKLEMEKADASHDASEDGEKTDQDQPEVLQFHGMNIRVHFNDDEEDLTADGTECPTGPDFWDRHFKEKAEVGWIPFRLKFLEDYGEKIVEKYSEDKKHFFVNMLYKDVFNLEKIVRRSVYDQFCEGNPTDDPHRFYSRLQEFAVGYYAMREVFNMDSSLRLTTIQNLGNFTFPAVISGLTNMLKDEEPNIRAVATIALAKSGKRRKRTVDKIIGQLEDEDRLVRESACLALGHLRAEGKAVTAVIDRWRNDPIKTVREAAEISLRRMGGDLANECVRVTNVLSSEMEALKTLGRK